jgi:hypothetical protein
MLEHIFCPYFNFVCSILLYHIRHFILLRFMKREMVPSRNRITV